jgi:hypothetical protein
MQEVSEIYTTKIIIAGTVAQSSPTKGKVRRIDNLGRRTWSRTRKYL